MHCRSNQKHCGGDMTILCSSLLAVAPMATGLEDLAAFLNDIEVIGCEVSQLVDRSRRASGSH